MKKLLVLLVILMMVLTACSQNAPDEKSELPYLNEARVKINDETYIFIVESYEIMDSMILINTDTGKSILVHETNCILCTRDTFE